MRISDLAREAGVPLATIKFYLREGLLQNGRLTSKTQAQYDDDHINRLRLVRFLIEFGHLTISATKELLASLDDAPKSIEDLLEIAHIALGRDDGKENIDIQDVQTMLRCWGWRVDDESYASLRSLSNDLSELNSVGVPLSREELDSFAKAMHEVAEIEVNQTPTIPDSGDRLHWVARTIAINLVLLDLRRLALHDVYRRRRESRGGSKA
jgi:DNA-binding transcriptional MerR regulator